METDGAAINAPRIGCIFCRKWRTLLQGAVRTQTGCYEGAFWCDKCHRVYIVRWDPADGSKYVLCDVKTGRSKQPTYREVERMISSRNTLRP